MRDLVDLFERALADVAEPQLAAAAIEAPAPRIAEAVGEDLRAVRRAVAADVAACVADERIVGRNGVGRALLEFATSMRSILPSSVSALSVADLPCGSPPPPPSPMPMYRKPSGPNAMLPPLWLFSGSSTLNSTSSVPARQRRAAILGAEFRDAVHEAQCGVAEPV